MNHWIVWMALPFTFCVHGPTYVESIIRIKEIDIWKYWMEQTMRSDVIPAIPGC